MESYESFDVVFRSDASGHVTVRRDRAGCTPQPFVYEADGEPSPEQLGTRLFRSLFRNALARELQRALERLRRDEISAIRLRLVFDPTVPRLAEISSLPWELLHDPHEDRFLAQNPRIHIVRFLAVRSASHAVPTDPPLAILLAYAEPRDCHALRLQEEAERLYETAAQAQFRVKFLHARSPRQIAEELERGRFDVLHFLGHGKRHRQTGEGTLLFEDAHGRSREISGPQLASALLGVPTLRLAVLNACDTASDGSPGESDPYAGVAAALVKAGLPAVVAMRSGISDSAALGFSETLYQNLARRESIESAVARARVRLAQDRPSSLEWATPALFLQSLDGDLFDLSGKRLRRTPWWRTWAAGVAALGLLLSLLVALQVAKSSETPSPASFSPYLTNPPECAPRLPELKLHLAYVEPDKVQLGSRRKTDLPELGLSLTQPFCIGKFEVTRWQWWYVMERPEGTPEPPPEEWYFPAEDVPYEAAEDFVRRLNRRVGESLYRLPQETEWEFVATGGFPSFEEMDEKILRRYANCGSSLQDGYDSVVPVGRLRPDRLGLFDVLGNVYEWVVPLDVGLEPGRVIRRGGSYDSGQAACSPTHRKMVLPDRKHYDSGLRLVREIMP